MSLSGHRLGKETVGLNGAKALFLTSLDGDIVRLPGNSLCDFVFILFLYSVSFSCILSSSFEASTNSSEFPRSFCLFCFGISGYSFGCVSDISLGTCVFICIQGKPQMRFLELGKAWNKGLWRRLETELDIV